MYSPTFVVLHFVLLSFSPATPSSTEYNVNRSLGSVCTSCSRIRWLEKPAHLLCQLFAAHSGHQAILLSCFCFTCCSLPSLTTINMFLTILSCLALLHKIPHLIVPTQMPPLCTLFPVAPLVQLILVFQSEVFSSVLPRGDIFFGFLQLLDPRYETCATDFDDLLSFLWVLLETSRPYQRVKVASDFVLIFASNKENARETCTTLNSSPMT